VYPDEGHGIGRPQNQEDLLRRTSAWFREHLGRSLRLANLG